MFLAARARFDRLPRFVSCAALLGMASFAGFLGCDSTSEDTGTIALVSGETDVLTATPAVTSLAVTLVDEDDDGGVTGSTALGTTTLPAADGTSGSSINLALSDVSSGAAGYLTVTGNDATNTTRVRGTSLGVSIGAIGGVTLDVFVQRDGQMSRLPGALAINHVSPLLAIAEGRFIAAVDPTDAKGTIDLYDLLAWGPTTSLALAQPADSLVAVGTLLYGINATSASYVDLYDDSTGTLSAPSGGTFAEIAGGIAVTAPDGTVYVVGGTRTSGAASPRILIVSPDGTGSFASLLTPRLGASATYIVGRGLVIAAGSSSGAGVEILPAGATMTTALAFPSDATGGAGAAALDTQHLVLAGGSGAPRVLDLACVTNCTATSWKALGTNLVNASAFPLDASSALTVGVDASGATHAYVVSALASTEVTLRVPRQNASAVALPTQGVAVVGGATSVESYIP